MREKYESLSLVVLKDLAKARGIKGVSAMKKSELVERMLQEDEQDKLKNAARVYEKPKTETVVEEKKEVYKTSSQDDHSSIAVKEEIRNRCVSIRIRLKVCDKFAAICFRGDPLLRILKLERNGKCPVCGKIAGASFAAENASAGRECAVAVRTAHASA